MFILAKWHGSIQDISEIYTATISNVNQLWCVFALEKSHATENERGLGTIFSEVGEINTQRLPIT